MPKVVVLSAHEDDYALSAFHTASNALGDPAGPEPVVITIFAGDPASAVPTVLDRAHGITDSRALMRERRRQDLAAIESTGARVVHLPFPDLQYRFRPSPALEAQIAQNPKHFARLVAASGELPADDDLAAEIARELQRYLTPATVLYAPLGIGDHPDHVVAAKVGAVLAGAVGQVQWYGDSPYFLRSGMPYWLDPCRQSAASLMLIARALERLERLGFRLELHPVLLSPELAARKVATIKMYETELPGLLDAYPQVTNPGVMRHEAVWAAPR